MTYSEAKEKVLAFLNDGDKDYPLLVSEPATEFEYGWIFGYNLAGALHPKLDEVEQKLRQALEEEANMDEAYATLSQEEKDIIDNSDGLAGNGPVFIDRETGEIYPCTRWSQEVFIQEIKERKTGHRFLWKLFLLDRLKGNIPKIKELKSVFGFTAKEVFDWLKLSRKKAILETDSMATVVHYKQIFEKLGLKYRIEEIKLEKNN